MCLQASLMHLNGQRVVDLTRSIGHLLRSSADTQTSPWMLALQTQRILWPILAPAPLQVSAYFVLSVSKLDVSLLLLLTGYLILPPIIILGLYTQN
jgi:hypothetical protein